jgi:exodeoxyribonuclease V beta subunit
VSEELYPWITISVEYLSCPDLLIEKDDEVIIVDYKTHTPEDERGYVKQIKRYKTAMENLKNRPAKGYILYLDKMEMKEI